MLELTSTAKALVAKGKGILAADESTSTIKRRLDSIKVENTEENRRAWRELLLSAPGVGKYISGVILYDETIRQRANDGRPFVDVMNSLGVIPGIKVDKSTGPLANAPGEVITEGLDGLRARLNEYRELGARFTKWRGVIAIGEHIPSQYCIDANSGALARYAALSQEAGLVPIVEPEVLMDGDHSIQRCQDVTERTLRRVFADLAEHRVSLEGMLLKPNMVLSGSDAANRAPAADVARSTLTAFKRSVPAAVPGIVFLSGGQGDDEATTNLNEINRLAAGEDTPWELSYSYGRGLQATPLKAWAGKASNVPLAQRAFLHRAKVTSAARDGAYTRDMETQA